MGCDINSLAVFVAKAKCTALNASETKALLAWALDIVPALNYMTRSTDPAEQDDRLKNLTGPKVRAVKKIICLALESIDSLPSNNAREFAKCALLNTGQWALNGRRSAASAEEFRARLGATLAEMVGAIELFGKRMFESPSIDAPILIHDSAEYLPTHPFFGSGNRVDLVITSPPYPGVHILYHRWQVDGRKETAAPYWIANRLDGQPSAYYNFGSRKERSLDAYFAASLRTLQGVRAVMKRGAKFVQMVAFSNPGEQLDRYMWNMKQAGFAEDLLSDGRGARAWRDVPGRSWHAIQKGATMASKELVLVHTAV
ncbi:hypothetical protein [Usitatibacter palustris]|uniref:hypothetical protein n=1 Tax=Usitatibacter palustris TaxID=2732487 RepID=UPI001FE7CD82